MARGKLRICLGAAPGVGKTYAMPAEAHRRVERGTDCAVAWVEHHDRPRTEVMLRGLEQVPRKEIEYRGGVFTGMDVDAVLRRAPAVALADEPAHTDVPGSRATKRRQDVEELLAAGTDVISTVNIRHLESLDDVVESITGVRQRETVPDEVVRRADQNELVDMSPEALRKAGGTRTSLPPFRTDRPEGDRSAVLLGTASVRPPQPSSRTVRAPLPGVLPGRFPSPFARRVSIPSRPSGSPSASRQDGSGTQEHRAYRRRRAPVRLPASGASRSPDPRFRTPLMPFGRHS